MSYIEFLSQNGYSQNLVDISKGLVKVPEFTVQAPADLSFGFPPVLIPLWSNGNWPGYIGMTKHWFGSRSDNFVQFYTGEYSFVEVARNLDQLKAWMVFDFLCNVPAPEEVGAFAESIGFCSSDEVDDIFSDCEDVSDLVKLSVFKNDVPSVIARSEESGSPGWLVEASGVAEIKSSIASGDYEKAWYQLNSSVISKGDILSLLNELSPYADDSEAFKSLIASWSEANL